MKNNIIFEKCLPNFGKELIADIEKSGIIKTFSDHEFIVKQGQLIHYLPIVLEGHVKAYSEEDGVQFLLYYIQQGASCIFSFVHLFNPNPIDFSAISEGKSTLLLIPVNKAKEWLIRFPSFNNLIIVEFQKHYSDLLHTTKQIICYKLEDRLWDYLKTKAKISGTYELAISHQSIADDLGTTREVISRLMKKIELDKKIIQNNRKIKVLISDF
ncbi:Crp/Fnr family transcriptional regulator [Chryseobacterium phosphatilyticum]|uniref:Crp/Fnr family transcriptional regulator n=1 Tax=Chryseobacterium phosphatilyticum TaxID=475075 RepID=A0A316XFL1_9FLAO|nr:Crp/Fnr family transcriptional regulator [Chryseobacterium phosphatilyticum]PWN71979.1 Crp/Fnr family transcriptional regulator [Chryseobacterium phosphatilyticum]